MGIKIGVYDFFSRVIPGGIVVIAILYLVQKDLLLSTNPANFSNLQIVALTILAYVLGCVLTPISLPWYRVFRPNNLHKRAIDELIEKHSGVDFELSNMDCFTLLAFIKRHNMEMSQEVEQFNVTSIMLRNISLSVLIFALIFCTEFVTGNFSLRSGFLSGLCVFAAIVLAKESVKFRMWFYQGIYQSAIALIAEPQNLPIKFQSKLRCESEGIHELDEEH